MSQCEICQKNESKKIISEVPICADCLLKLRKACRGDQSERDFFSDKSNLTEASPAAIKMITVALKASAKKPEPVKNSETTPKPIKDKSSASLWDNVRAHIFSKPAEAACPECGNPVSRDTNICQNCGYPVNIKTKGIIKKIFMSIAVCGVISLLIICLKLVFKDPLIGEWGIVSALSGANELMTDELGTFSEIFVDNDQFVIVFEDTYGGSFSDIDKGSWQMLNKKDGKIRYLLSGENDNYFVSIKKNDRDHLSLESAKKKSSKSILLIYEKK